MCPMIKILNIFFRKNNIKHICKNYKLKYFKNVLIKKFQNNLMLKTKTSNRNAGTT